MNSPIQQSRRNQRGVSVVEGLVAIFIFGIVFLAALMLYSSANRAYLSTDATTIQQQNVRFAMDRMGETLRDGGANFNPLGSRTLPDEQLEGAWQSAVVVRGDFDNLRETPRETATVYPIVTTGNDEIVAYVLRQAVPAAGADPNNIAITVKADFRGGANGTTALQRDATTDGTTISNEETATIMVAATNLAQQTNPPYQLVRVTFDDSVNPKYDVIADNIFRLSFDYRAADGTVAVATVGSDDLQRAERAAVRRIDVNLIGMTDRPDLGYRDPNTYVPAETAATRNRRKFSLSEQIVMPNMGIIGRRHLVAPQLAIEAPPSLTVCTGHCRNFHVSWTASPTAGVSQYMVRVTAPAISGGVAAVDDNIPVNGLSLEYEQPDNEARAYTFAVAGVVSGVTGTASTPITTTATHDTTNSVPSAVGVLTTGRTIGRNSLTVAWDEVRTNVGTLTAPTCTTVGAGAGLSAPPSPWNNRAVDMVLDDQEGTETGAAYKVYRIRATGGNNGGFTPAAANKIDDVPVGAVTNTPPSSGQFVDNTAAPCTGYYYRAQACDLCGINGGFSPAMTTPAHFVPEAGVIPRAPATLLPVSTPTVAGGNYTFRLTWPYVTTTTANAQAVAMHYLIERYRSISASGPWTAVGTPLDVYDTNVSDVITLPTEAAGVPLFYRFYVRAQYDCGLYNDTNRTSDVSPAYDLACTPAAVNTISLAQPVDGTAISRPYETGTPIRAVTTGTAWTGAQVQITGINGVVYSETVTGPPVTNAGTTGYTFPPWDASTLPDGEYTVALVGIAGSCRSPVYTRTVAVETNTCGLEIVQATFTGNGNNYAQTMTFKVQNTCDGANLTLNGLTPSWSGTHSSIRIRRVSGPSLYYDDGTGTASGELIAFEGGTTLPVNAGTTTTEITFRFSDNFSIDLDDDGAKGQFNSILGRIVSPAGTDELLSGTRIP